MNKIFVFIFSFLGLMTVLSLYMLVVVLRVKIKVKNGTVNLESLMISIEKDLMRLLGETWMR